MISAITLVGRGALIEKLSEQQRVHRPIIWLATEQFGVPGFCCCKVGSEDGRVYILQVHLLAGQTQREPGDRAMFRFMSSSFKGNLLISTRGTGPSKIQRI